jgi:PKHD-type hydroxylase
MKFDYYFLQNYYTLEECKTIANNLERDSDENFINPNAGSVVVKSSKVIAVPYKRAKSYIQDFVEIIKHINTEVFGLDIYNINDNNLISYNKYDIDSEYGWHNDFPRGEQYDFKLTALINLSDEIYEGGEFEFFLNGPKRIPEFTPGSIIIFPSFIQHRVLPVTSGKRKSLSVFVRGPSLR